MSFRKLLKVSFFDRKIISDWIKTISTVFFIISTVLSFFNFTPLSKIILFTDTIIVLAFYYLYLVMKANKLKSIDFYIGKTKITIKEGDIFNSGNSKLKIIAFNEYFDTIVDDEIISRNSINGQFIDNLDKNQKKALNEEIGRLKDGFIEDNVSRDKGNHRKFKLGTSIKFNDEFIITAFTKFDDNNRAYLHMKDLLAFYMNLWDSLDALYNSKPLVIPVLGSGITRIKEYDIDDQELLEIMLWTLKISKIKFDHPSNLTIIIYSDRFNRVNLYKIKEGNYGI